MQNSTVAVLLRFHEVWSSWISFIEGALVDVLIDTFRIMWKAEIWGFYFRSVFAHNLFARVTPGERNFKVDFNEQNQAVAPGKGRRVFRDERVVRFAVKIQERHQRYSLTFSSVFNLFRTLRTRKQLKIVFQRSNKLYRAL